MRIYFIVAKKIINSFTVISNNVENLNEYTCKVNKGAVCLPLLILLLRMASPLYEGQQNFEMILVQNFIPNKN